MVQFRYFRVERNRIDTVVLMLPDISATPGLMPSPESYTLLEEQLKQQLADKLAAIDAEEFVVKSTQQNSSSPTSVPVVNQDVGLVADAEKSLSSDKTLGPGEEARSSDAEHSATNPPTTDQTEVLIKKFKPFSAGCD